MTKIKAHRTAVHLRLICMMGAKFQLVAAYYYTLQWLSFQGWRLKNPREMTEGGSLMLIARLIRIWSSILVLQYRTPSFPQKYRTPAQIERDYYSGHADYAGYQITREEFFAHSRESQLTICGNKLYLNKICLRKAPDISRIQVLINEEDGYWTIIFWVSFSWRADRKSHWDYFC